MPVKIQPLPSLEYLRECFDYDPKLGRLTWRDRPRDHFHSAQQARYFKTRCAGREVRTTTCSRSRHRQLAITINGVQQKFLAHRIAFKLMTGRDPEHGVDHLDGDGGNNAWWNLREATHAENARNVRKHNDGRSRFKGVYPSGPRFFATVYADGKAHYLGTFGTEEEAAKARTAVAQKLHGAFYRPEVSVFD